MNVLNFEVKGSVLRLKSGKRIASGSANFDRCKFTFDSQWKSTVKTAVIAADSTEPVMLFLDDSGCCTIPPELIKEKTVISIGVCGVTGDGIKITTNTISHYVIEGTPAAEQYTGERNDLYTQVLARLGYYSEKYECTILQILELINGGCPVDNLDEEIPKVSPMCPGTFKDDWYYPPYIERCPSVVTDYSTKYEELLADTFDTLSDLKKEMIGADQSGTYHIYSYTYEPEFYEKTLVVLSNIHGNEYDTFYALFAALRNFLSEPLCNANIRYLREKIKLVVVPVVNPYGFSSSTKYNSRGVDINRNFDYRHEHCRNTSIKGSAPESETETSAVANLLRSLSAENLVGLIDLHSNTTFSYGKYFTFPGFANSCENDVVYLAERFNRGALESSPEAKQNFVMSYLPLAINYAANSFGINALSIDWCSEVYGDAGSAHSLTKFTELFTNMLLCLSKQKKTRTSKAPEAFSRQIIWYSEQSEGAIAVPESTSCDELEFTRHMFEMNGNYNVVAQGYVKIEVVKNCTLSIGIILSQENTAFDPTNSIKNRMVNKVNFTPGEYFMPLYSNTSGAVSNLDTASGAGKLKFCLCVCSNEPSSAWVKGYNCVVQFVPTNQKLNSGVCIPIGNPGDFIGSSGYPETELIMPITTGDIDYYYYND